MKPYQDSRPLSRSEGDEGKKGSPAEIESASKKKKVENSCRIHVRARF